MESNEQHFHPLGNKTLLMLVIRRCSAVLIFILILFLALWGLFYVPREYMNIAIGAFFAYFMFVILFGLVAVFLGWLEYSRYEITLGDKTLKLQRGLISVEQVGIPYRYVQDIKIDRSLLDQIIGVSDLLLTTSGSEQQEIHPDTDDPAVRRIVLPAIEDKLAMQIQEMILAKAQVQQIDIQDRKVV